MWQVNGTQQHEKKTYKVIVTDSDALATDTLEYCKHHTDESDWKFEKTSFTSPSLPQVDYREFSSDKPRERPEE